MFYPPATAISNARRRASIARPSASLSTLMASPSSRALTLSASPTAVSPAGRQSVRRDPRSLSAPGYDRALRAAQRRWRELLAPSRRRAPGHVRLAREPRSRAFAPSRRRALAPRWRPSRSAAPSPRRAADPSNRRALTTSRRQTTSDKANMRMRWPGSRVACGISRTSPASFYYITAPCVYTAIPNVRKHIDLLAFKATCMRAINICNVFA
jgi:hypothetical protein